MITRQKPVQSFNLRESSGFCIQFCQAAVNYFPVSTAVVIIFYSRIPAGRQTVMQGRKY